MTTPDVSQAVNEHLIAENARLTFENTELRNTVSFARDQWKTMQSIIERLDRMDTRLEMALEGRGYETTSRDRDLLRKIKNDKYTNSPF